MQPEHQKIPFLPSIFSGYVSDVCVTHDKLGTHKFQVPGYLFSAFPQE